MRLNMKNSPFPPQNPQKTFPKKIPVLLLALISSALASDCILYNKMTEPLFSEEESTGPFFAENRVVMSGGTSVPLVEGFAPGEEGVVAFVVSNAQPRNEHVDLGFTPDNSDYRAFIGVDGANGHHFRDGEIVKRWEEYLQFFGGDVVVFSIRFVGGIRSLFYGRVGREGAAAYMREKRGLTMEELCGDWYFLDTLDPDVVYFPVVRMETSPVTRVEVLLYAGLNGTCGPGDASLFPCGALDGLKSNVFEEACDWPETVSIASWDTQRWVVDAAEPTTIRDERRLHTIVTNGPTAARGASGAYRVDEDKVLRFRIRVSGYSGSESVWVGVIEEGPDDTACVRSTPRRSVVDVITGTSYPTVSSLGYSVDHDEKIVWVEVDLESGVTHIGVEDGEKCGPSIQVADMPNHSAFPFVCTREASVRFELLSYLDPVENVQIENCPWGTRTEFLPQCSNSLSIDGIHLNNHSVVELDINGTTRQICSHDFGIDEATVTCSMLGFPEPHPSSVQFRSKLPTKNDPPPPTFQDLDCFGYESSLLDCSFSSQKSSKNDSTCSRAIVSGCAPTSPHFDPSTIHAFEGDVRVVSGSTNSLSYEGRAEVFHAGEWRMICADGDVGSLEADMICHQAYGIYSTSVLEDTLPASHNNYWIEDLRCDGTESHIGLCSFPTWGEVTHCTAPFGVRCDNASLALLNDTHGNPGDIRLMGSEHAHEGRVEIYHDGQWRMVCDDGWDTEDGRVVCEELGFDGVREISISADELYGRNPNGFWITNVNCGGYEDSLADCPHSDFGDLSGCASTEVAGVLCYAATISDPTDDADDSSAIGVEGGVRLVSDDFYSTDDEGYVEIYHSGEWRGICDSQWDDKDAEVVCRQLGLGTNEASAVSAEDYGYSPRGIWLSNVRCSGLESKLVDCPSDDWAETSCDETSHSAAVVCAGVYEAVNGGLVAGIAVLGVLIFLGIIGAVWYFRCRRRPQPESSPTTTTTSPPPQNTSSSRRPILQENPISRLSKKPDIYSTQTPSRPPAAPSYPGSVPPAPSYPGKAPEIL